MEKVITVQGDTWDTIAKRVYGDERLAQALMESRDNAPLLDIQIFPAGVVVTAPDVEQQSINQVDLPDWRK